MKKLILIAASAFLTSMASAQSSASAFMQERKETIKDEQNARHSMVQLEGSNDFKAYIKGAQEEVANNESRIAALKAKLMNEKNAGDKKLEKATKKLEKNIIIAEKYNQELKTDLNNYVKYGTGDWKLFKEEFNQDLTELSKDLTDLRHD